MATNYVFADEAGCFTLKRAPNISRYFIVCTVTMQSCDIGHDLLELRRQLVLKKDPVAEFFHATNDKQVIRDAVFEMLAGHKFDIQATIMEKSKAEPQVTVTSSRFYKYGWLYHFRYSIAKKLPSNDNLFITAASVKTKKAQAVFTNAVNDVVQQHLPRERWATGFWPSSHDPCLQIADYCTWALQRKWESNGKDLRSYNLIKNRVTHEFDLWQRGSKHYY
jgi:hypothetical protein